MKKLPPPCSGKGRYNMLLFDTLCAVAPPSLVGLLGRTFIPPTISSQYSTQKERREREGGREDKTDEDEDGRDAVSRGF